LAAGALAFIALFFVQNVFEMEVVRPADSAVTWNTSVLPSVDQGLPDILWLPDLASQLPVAVAEPELSTDSTGND